MYIVNVFDSIYSFESIWLCESKSRKYWGIFEVKKYRKSWQILEKNGLNNKSIIMQVKKKGMEPVVRKGKHYLLACHSYCKCSIETSRSLN